MYKIEITKTETVETLTARDWEKGGPDGRCDEDKDNPEAYGYTPQIPQKKSRTTTVLSMTAKDMDVTAVATAILDNSESL